MGRGHGNVRACLSSPAPGAKGQTRGWQSWSSSPQLHVDSKLADLHTHDNGWWRRRMRGSPAGRRRQRVAAA